MKLPALRAVPGSFAAVGAFLQKLFRLYDIFVHYRSEYVDNLLRKPPRLSHPPAALFFWLHSSINMNWWMNATLQIKNHTQGVW